MATEPDSVILSNTCPAVQNIGSERPAYFCRKSALNVISRYYRLHFHLNRGQILHRLGRYDDAAQEFRTVLRLDWRHEEAAQWIGRTEQAKRESHSSAHAGRRANDRSPGPERLRLSFASVVPFLFLG
jgi:Tetratricopeptide repeat.